MEIKPGYKQTEVGVIPNDWQLKELGAIGSFKNGINKDSNSFGSGFPFVNLMDVFEVVKIDSSQRLGLVLSSESEQRKYDLRQGDILFVRSSVKPSGVGLTAVIEEDLLNTVYSGFLLRFRDNNYINRSFKRYCFYESGFRSRVINSSSVSANTNINQESLKKILLVLPPTLVEQERIARALSDVDGLIEALQRLIDKKRLIRQGAMQRLLNPYKNGQLKAGWEVKKVYDLARLITKGTTPTTLGLSFTDTGINFVKVESLSVTGKIIPTKVAHIDRFTHTLLKRSQLEVDDILISIAGALGRVSMVSSEILPANTNQALAIIRLRDDLHLEKKYLLYFLKSDYVCNQIELINVQAAQANLSLQNISELEIGLPILEEQKAIAATLSDMDAEIEALEQKLAKYRQIKQGMMQELLTGKTRLVEPSGDLQDLAGIVKNAPADAAVNLASRL